MVVLWHVYVTYLVEQIGLHGPTRVMKTTEGNIYDGNIVWVPLTNTECVVTNWFHLHFQSFTPHLMKMQRNLQLCHSRFTQLPFHANQVILQLIIYVRHPLLSFSD